METHGVQKIGMNIDFESGHVIKLDAVFFQQPACSVKGAQIAAAARVAFHRQAGIDNRPVRAQAVRHFAQVVIARPVKRREKPIVAVDTVRIGEVIFFRQQYRSDTCACCIAGMNTFAPSTEVLCQSAGIGCGEPDGNRHLSRIEFDHAARRRSSGRAAVERSRMKTAPSQFWFVLPAGERQALKHFQTDAYRSHYIRATRTGFFGHCQRARQDAGGRMRKAGVVVIQQMRE